MRCALGTETFGMIDACEAEVTIQLDQRHIFRQTFKIVILTDSETIFNFIIGNEPTTEKRLMIDTKASRDP